ncbi:hypothetical protein LIER_04332 [Lithospermum erythrorhizon]|uniref:J domain-containing protein n=1 Tax=Lithospermum erythrorhizon TaxID=34254 RepID=A0AAV3NWT7_LITER
MECNRDEAFRAKSKAEEKIERKDYSGAKKFALKAQSLYPGLEGISQLLTTIDVFESAENKISGEVDWYGVLGVMPSVDDKTLKKQYRKLALVLHPDKNKSVGADGAFRLLSEAWSLLSDKANRLAYNQRRSSRGFQQKVNINSGGPSAPPHANGFHSFSSRSASAPKTQHSFSSRSASAPKSRRPIAPKAVPAPSYKRNDTFWTICDRCNMHYEYLKVYLNNTLLCPNCHGPFTAKETASPFSHPMPSNSATAQYHQSSSAQSSNSTLGPGSNAPRPVPNGRNAYNYADLQRGQPSRSASTNSPDPSIALGKEKMKRERDASHIFSSFSEGETLFKTSRSGSQATFAHGIPGTYQKPKSFTELAPIEIHKILVEKGRNEVQKKLNEWKPKTAEKVAGIMNEKVNASYEAAYKKQHDENGIEELSSSKGPDPAKSSCDGASDDVEEGNLVDESMNVPDPDFHDFDLDRSENSFGDNEVWSAYDDDDGMPRFYALINKVISRKPFKVKLAWLNSKTNSEFSTINWMGSGFYKSCGEFRVGKYETYKSIDSFSHKVKWFKGSRGTVHIFPKKGDAWGLYRNWSPDWNELTPDEVIHEYDVALVLNDYNEEQGISVAPLVKVPGFRTVFHPHKDPEKIRRIPKEEMFRFSHRIPNYLLTSADVKYAPQDCQELDPAATPAEFLHVAPEDEGPIGDNNGDATIKNSTSQVD